MITDRQRQATRVLVRLLVVRGSSTEPVDVDPHGKNVHVYHSGHARGCGLTGGTRCWRFEVGKVTTREQVRAGDAGWVTTARSSTSKLAARLVLHRIEARADGRMRCTVCAEVLNEGSPCECPGVPYTGAAFTLQGG